MVWLWLVSSRTSLTGSCTEPLRRETQGSSFYPLDASTALYYHTFMKARRGFLFTNTIVFMNALTTYLRNVRAEFTHIVWPTRSTAIAHALVVAVIAIAITLLVGVIDYLLGGVVSRIVGA